MTNDLQIFLNTGMITISKLLLKNFHQLNMTNEELLVFLQLVDFHDSKIDFPDFEVIGQRLKLPANRIYTLVNQLIEKKLIYLRSRLNEQNQQSDYYDLTVTFEKLIQLEKQKNNTLAQTDDRQMIYQAVEKQLGRTLSPIDNQFIADWLDIDQYQSELIQLAVREAILNQVSSLKYIDKILQNWTKQGIHNAQDLQNYRQRHTF